MWKVCLFCVATLSCHAALLPSRSDAGSPADAPQVDDGGGRRRVWMRDHRVRLRTFGTVVVAQEEIRLQGGWETKEYRYRLLLPEGAVITGFKVEREGRWATGRVLDARYVGREYVDLSGLPRRPDPGLVRQVGADRYLVRVWPVGPGRPVRFLVSWAAAARVRQGHRVISLRASKRDRRLTDTKVLLVGRASSWRTQKLGQALSLDLGPVTGRPPLVSRLVRTARGLPGCAAHNSRAILLSLAGVRSSKASAGIRLVLLVDRSHSMWPGSFGQAAVLLKRLSSRLRDSDRLALLAFDRHTVQFGRGWMRPGQARLRDAGRWLRRSGGGNGTDLTGALLRVSRLFDALPAGSRFRRVVVLLTDGLLPDSFVARIASRFLRGVELVALVGAQGSGSGMDLSEGPVASLVRLRGGIGWAFDPAAFLRPCRSCPLARVVDAILSAEPVTGLTMTIDGRPVERVPSSLTTVSGALAVFWWPGAFAEARLRFSHRGKWLERRVRPLTVDGTAGRVLLSLAAARSIEGMLQRRPPTETKRRLVADRALACAKGAGIVSPISALAALDLTEPFSRDRWRFVSRWGDRFFSRIGTGSRSPAAAASIWQGGTRRLAAVRLSAGSLTEKIVLSRIQRGFLRQAKRCYESVLDAGARPDVTLQGRLVLRLELTRGEVADVHIERPEFAHRKLFSCLTEAAFNLRIPYSRADRTLYQVLYPLRFRLDDRSVEMIRSANYVPRQVRSGDPLEDIE